jgi:hypothetical protein
MNSRIEVRQVNRETQTRKNFVKWCAAVGVLLASLISFGCNPNKAAPVLTNPYPRPMNIAVAPFRNLSGTSDVDVMAVTDEFYTELQQVSGLEVMPVNRVLAAFQELNLENVQNPDDVLKLAQTLDVDGVIVGSVTRYNPYPPPEVGMVVQMFLRENSEDAGTVNYVNPGELSRAGQPFQLNAAKMIRPTAMVVKIFDSRQNDVKKQIERFARSRTDSKTPYGWKHYMKRRNYLRFVSYEMIGELLSQEKLRMETKVQDQNHDAPKGNIAGKRK